jgi:hypothetical protein
VNLVLLGMQQNRAALAADVIHGVVTRDKHGRRFQCDALCRRSNYFKADLASGHNVLPVTGGSVTTLSHRRLAQSRCR